jgi:hypothetical protein
LKEKSDKEAKKKQGKGLAGKANFCSQNRSLKVSKSWGYVFLLIENH